MISFCVARRDSSERSKRSKRSDTPVTSGARTRRASSRSSCPVWSPSRTTIAFPSIRPLTSPGLGLQPRGYKRNSMARRGGWRRLGSRGRFRYVDARGKPIADPEVLERIEALRIPPAWRDVRISPRPYAKLQATGVDRAGRVQYLYHPEYRARQEQAKFDKLIRFAERLPDLRAAMAQHMDEEPLTFEW